MVIKDTILGLFSSEAKHDERRKAASKMAAKIEARTDEISNVFEKADDMIVERTVRFLNITQRLENLVLEQISQQTSYNSKQMQATESQSLLQSSLSKKFIEQSKNPFNLWVHSTLACTLPNILHTETLLPRLHVIAPRIQSEISMNKDIDLSHLLSQWLDSFYYPIKRTLSSIKDPKLRRDFSGAGPGQFNGAWGIAVHPMTGEIYVADYSNHRVQVFTPEFEYIRSIGRHGGHKGELNYPIGVCFTPEGDLIVSEHMNHRIQKFSADGISLWTVGTLGSGNGQFCNHYGVAVDRHGFVYVSDWGNSRIQKFSPDGTFSLVISLSNSGCSTKKPDGILATERDELLSISIGGDQVNVFSIDGSFLRSFKVDRHSGYSCMCRGPQGTFAISDRQGGHVRFYDYDGKLLHHIKFPDASGLGFALDGRLYLSSMKNVIAIY
eukprot:TRINITY_DN5370_c0_g1_i1.p1 TRINITY_DN5370_c0_g1~~TRINITY_DN5370_c0_g1_i1.p1  ORF type:complete len:439 (+),score=86.71 TRINITY_DN5370_c0_g1_i1:68-1384(+)